tara:strand:- start:4361 stop:7195 length:2835 start_codon:yes stop_codon:yes gene_type:complete
MATKLQQTPLQRVYIEADNTNLVDAQNTDNNVQTLTLGSVIAGDPFRQDANIFWTQRKLVPNPAERNNKYVYDPDGHLSLISTPQYSLSTTNNKEFCIRSRALAGKKVYFRPVTVAQDEAMWSMNGTSLPTKTEQYRVYVPNTSDYTMPKLNESLQGTTSFLINNASQTLQVQWWEQWINFNFPQGSFYKDHYFSMDLPTPKDISSFVPNQNFVHIKTNYNFYFEEYEDAIAMDEVPEVLLPNLYTYMYVSDWNYDVNQANWEETKFKYLSPFINHATFGGLLPTDNVISIYAEAGLPNAPMSLEPLGSINRYFDTWSKTVGDFYNPNFKFGEAIQTEVLDEVVQDFDKIAFAEDSYKTTFKHNRVAKQFPMNVEVTFSTDNRNNFLNMLKQSNQYDNLLLYLLNSPGETKEATVLAQANANTSIVTDMVEWDLTNFFNEIDPISNKFNSVLQKKQDFVYLGKNVSPAPENQFFNQLMAIGLKTKFNNFAKKHTRGFEEILNGAEAYEEIVLYEMEKWSSNVNGEPQELLQRFYLPNDEDKILTFFDTQVKYAKFYVYKMYAYKLVIGSMYSYNQSSVSSLSSPSIGDAGSYGNDPLAGGGSPLDSPIAYSSDTAQLGSANLSVEITPSPKIIKVPYYNAGPPPVFRTTGDAYSLITGEPINNQVEHQTTYVLDDPPLAPEIEIVPLMEDRRDIIINIRDTIGQSIDTPKPINTPGGFKNFNDTTIFKLIATVQKKNEDNISLEQAQKIITDSSFYTINFSSDEPAKEFQVFRTKTKPVIYQNFSDSLYETVSGPNGSTKVRLNYNEKNYFVFRTVDNHGKFSNPTDVYEVEIKEDSGISYPVIRAFNLLTENAKTSKTKYVFSLAGRKFIYLKPAFEQWDMTEKYNEADYNSAFDIPNFSLGTSKESVFQENRKFKIRLTSKKTNRKIDINVSCKQKNKKVIQ